MAPMEWSIEYVFLVETLLVLILFYLSITFIRLPSLNALWLLVINKHIFIWKDYYSQTLQIFRLVQFSCATNQKMSKESLCGINQFPDCCAGSRSVPADSSGYPHHHNKAGFHSTHYRDGHYYIAEASCTAGNATIHHWDIPRTTFHCEPFNIQQQKALFRLILVASVPSH